MATRFRFRLEPLLKLRKSLEQEAQRQLAKAVTARNEAEGRLQDLERRHRDGLASRRSAPGQTIDLAVWADLERFLVILEKRILHAKLDLEEAEQRVVKARQTLTRAHQDHLTLLRLKERRQEQHAREAFLEEIRQADEIAVLRQRFSGARPQRAPAS